MKFTGLSFFLVLFFYITPLLAAVPMEDTSDGRTASFIAPVAKPKAVVEKKVEEKKVLKKIDLNKETIKVKVKTKAKKTLPKKAQSKAVPIAIEKGKPVVIEAPKKTVSKTQLKTKKAVPPSVKKGVVPRKKLSVPKKKKAVQAKKTISTASIPDVSPESIGILSDSNEGLGAAMWKGTSRRMINLLMPALVLPLEFSELNDLARRFLLTIAAVPQSQEENPKPLPDLVSLRVEKLLALGDVKDAWDLSVLFRPKKIDEITLRLLTEAMLVKGDKKKACEKNADLISSYSKAKSTGGEWQKAFIYCQLMKGDKKAVQLGFDLLREQKVRKDAFLKILDKNVLKTSKKLPDNLLPLRALNLGILDHINKPLPAAFYKNPSASLIPELLQAKASDEKARLSLAERAAQAEQITPSQLAAVYKSIPFSSEEIAKALRYKRGNARSRALSYQAAVIEKDPQRKIELVQKILGSVSDRALTGALGKLMSSLVQDIPAIPEYSIFAVQGVRLFALAGKPKIGMKWLKLARSLAPHFAEVGVQLASYWPVIVLSGLEADGSYARGMKDWLFVALVPGTAEQNRERRDYAGRIMIILAAAGYAISEESWLRVTEALPVKKGIVPSPVLLERLERASKDGRKG
ncbi:MAG TPA: hypothetical protein DD400_01935, partial [Rhodospirillaceae bacterium]|nr:hypothetical protein [Rhodospirillaceae bacterium]